MTKRHPQSILQAVLEDIIKGTLSFNFCFQAHVIFANLSSTRDRSSKCEILP